jgi:muramoyltetrapeptide carboxypeptidase
VIAPAGEVDAEALERSIDALRHHGFRLKLARGLGDRARYLAGPAADRAKDFLTMFSDPDVSCVIAARGGYGSIQILPYLDAQVVRDNPKPFVGYSDVTILLNWIAQSCRLVSFHGPMVVDLSKTEKKDTAEALFPFLFGRELWQEIPFISMRGGTARAPLVGGCLSVVVSTLATPYEIETEGAILFLEDVAEKPYRLERALDQLRLAGKLKGLQGVLFGNLGGWAQSKDEERHVLEIIEEIFSPYPYPIGSGIPSGHGEKNLPLPIGFELTMSNGLLRLEESPFSTPR